jgi:hypothetical protein
MASDPKPTIFVFCNSCAPEWHSIVALAEDGTGLAGHACSSHGFALHDMGLTSNWKHDKYDKHYPDGWKLEWVDSPLEHPVLAGVIARLRKENPDGTPSEPTPNH